MIENGGSLAALAHERLDPESAAFFHSMDISGSVYKRMKELGMSKKELAARMGVSPAQITKIFKGSQNMTLKTIAKLEDALGIDMTEGFRNPITSPSFAYDRSSQLIKHEDCSFKSTGNGVQSPVTLATSSTSLS